MSHAPGIINLDPCPVHLVDTSQTHKVTAAPAQRYPELLRGWTRYEKVRKLVPAAFNRLHAINISGGGNFDEMIDALPEPTTPVPEQPATADDAVSRQQLIDWVVICWNAEVKNRPMVNVHRRSLDDAWRQMLRHLGVDDRARLGPTHDELRAGINSKEWEAMKGKAATKQQEAVGDPLVDLRNAVAFLDQMRAAAEAGEDVAGTGVAKDARNWLERAARAAIDPRAVTTVGFPPPLDDDLREILGRPNFACGEIASLLRVMGHEIAKKAEAEQAAVIHWMLAKYAAHGGDWWTHCRAELQAVIDSAKAGGQEGASRKSTGTGGAEHG
jgi:hypothetical protein